MACPTCNHTLQTLPVEPLTRWCPRCGTLMDTAGISEAPKLVARCQKYETAALDYDHDPRALLLWVSIGIEESIRLPEDRG